MRKEAIVTYLKNEKLDKRAKEALVTYWKLRTDESELKTTLRKIRSGLTTMQRERSRLVNLLTPTKHSTTLQDRYTDKLVQIEVQLDELKEKILKTTHALAEKQKQLKRYTTTPSAPEDDPFD